jgi:hypothetical protein
MEDTNLKVQIDSVGLFSSHFKLLFKVGIGLRSGDSRAAVGDAHRVRHEAAEQQQYAGEEFVRGKSSGVRRVRGFGYVRR